MTDYEKDQEANDRAVRIAPWLLLLFGVPIAYGVYTFWPIIKFGITGILPQ